MSDKMNNSQDDDKNGGTKAGPNQVYEADKHLGAIAEEDPAQSDQKAAAKGKEGKQNQLDEKRSA
jgi:hypothetical protein